MKEKERTSGGRAERERERERENRGGTHTERETQNLKQAPGSELSTQSLTWSPKSGTVRL